ncbi:ATP-grasp domain-containing protein [Streptomyces sp. NBC_01497]|uniref:ATP-grasp domain-containing protein n=1 Tax=Streptomyces sp. NBC_01497 TaxID=2903885 RepID=UPI002E34B8BE|nr:ATP-grasp domain-containing protein [Streptomyces sp. NBC_01497]
MTFALIESLNLGLGRLADAAHARGHDLHLLTADRSRYAFELSQPSAASVTVTSVDTNDITEIVAALRRIPTLAGVVRMTDQWTAQALAAAQALGLPHEDPEAVALLRDKGRLRDHLYRHGFSAVSSVTFEPLSVDPAELSRTLPFPCVIKDVSGSRSKDVWLVKESAELAPVLGEAARTVGARGGKITAEPYLLGPLYSAETLTWGSETRLLGVTSRVVSAEPYFREEAGSFPVDFPEKTLRGLSDWVSAILLSTGYREGFTHTEFIVTSHGFEIVEINPRLGGALIGEAIRQSLDVDVHDAYLDLALGQRPALMDVLLEPRRGMAQVCVYAPRAGIFEGFTGTDLLPAHPGNPVLYPLREAGAWIPSTTDQRGALAFLLAGGDTSELAFHHAVSAANKLGARMQTGDPAGDR